MQQGFGFCALVEITGFLPQHEIRYKSGSAHDVLAETLKFAWKQDEPAISTHDKKNNNQGRKDSLRPAGIKVPKAKGVTIEAFANDRSDQKARNDKEDIDAHVSAREATHSGMETNDR
jgi:hypothetical protein